MWLIRALVIGVAISCAVGALAEAYGAGPPYDGCTTNIDKWTSPWPIVAIAAGGCAAVIGVGRRERARRRRG